MIKAALKCRTSVHWVKELPTVLLGIRSVVKEDVGATMAEMVYGETLRLPGEFFEPNSPLIPTTEFAQELSRHFSNMRPTPTSNHSTAITAFIPKHLADCKYVFIRHDAVRKPLQRPYDGPYRVIQRAEKHFTLRIGQKDLAIGIDRLKPAFGVIQDEDQPSLTRTPIKSNTSSKPTEITKPPEPISSKTKTTRSGRHVHFPQRYMS